MTLPELAVELKEDFSFSGRCQVRGTRQCLEVQRLALCDSHLEFFSDLWSHQKVSCFELAHWPILAAESEEFVGDLKVIILPISFKGI